MVVIFLQSKEQKPNLQAECGDPKIKTLYFPLKLPSPPQLKQQVHIQEKQKL